MRTDVSMLLDALNDDDPHSWRYDAVCREYPPELFFPAGESGFAADQIESAKRICAVCPVIDECLDYAIVNAQRSGIWGGLTEGERRPLRRRYVANLKLMALTS